MSQITPRVRILLAVVVVLGLGYFIVLRPHAQNNSTSTPPTPAAAAPAPPVSAKAPASNSHLAPGVSGRVNHPTKAQTPPSDHGTVTPKPATSTTLSTSVSVSSGANGFSIHLRVLPSKGKGAAAAKPAAPANPLAPAMAVESELKTGKTVAVLFWDPAGSDDQAVHSALESLVTKHGSLVVHVATADQAADYGTITSTEQVLDTPTVLLMRGKSVEEITDLQSATDLRTFINQLDAGGANVAQVPNFTALDSGPSARAYLTNANRMCTSALSSFAAKPDPNSTPALLASVLASEEGVTSRLVSMGPPRADRGYVTSIRQVSVDGAQEATSSSRFTSARNDAAARAAELGAQTNYDDLTSMLENYGLVDCVVPASR